MKRIVALALALLSAGAWAAGEVVLVTAVQGAVVVEGIGSGKTPLEPFVRLKDGDRLTLPAATQASLVYVGRGRVENWRGAGVVSVGDSESKVVGGKPELAVRQIPADVARQMNRTPTAAPDGRVGMLRMRSIPSMDAIARLDKEYAELRDKVAKGDSTPEVYLLAGLYDLRQYERLKEELDRVAREYPQDANLAALRQLYTQAIPKPAGEQR